MLLPLHFILHRLLIKSELHTTATPSRIRCFVIGSNGDDCHNDNCPSDLCPMVRMTSFVYHIQLTRFKTLKTRTLTEQDRHPCPHKLRTCHVVFGGDVSPTPIMCLATQTKVRIQFCSCNVYHLGHVNHLISTCLFQPSTFRLDYATFAVEFILRSPSTLVRITVGSDA